MHASPVATSGPLQRLSAALAGVAELLRTPFARRLRALEQANAQLEQEITLRAAAELDLRASCRELELRVAQRTSELSEANERLAQEIQERERTEQALHYNETLLRRLHDSLEEHIAERTAELTRTIAELEAFSYSVSHDLRAPLRAINGYAAIIQEEHAGAIDAEGRELLARIARNAANMGELIDGLLDFSRLARCDADSSEVDMTALAAQTKDELVREHGASVEIVIDELPRASGNEAMLRQVWTNLLSNAIKFSRPRAHPRVEVRGEAHVDEIVYSVRDNGVGFDITYAGKLFGVFSRLHSAREFPGVGVGLAIVRRVVQRHGGRVWADSRAGEGSTFCFSLPAQRSEATTRSAS